MLATFPCVNVCFTEERETYFNKMFQCCFSLIDLISCMLYNWTIYFADGMLFFHTHTAMFALVVEIKVFVTYSLRNPFSTFESEMLF